MKKILLWLIPMLFFGVGIQGQSCPASASVTLSTASTPNTCGGNGSITATFSPGGSSGNITVQLLKNGTVQTAVINPASPYTFTNLQPGTDYQVKLICSSDNSVAYNTANVTVADNYVPITALSIGATNVCNNFTKGGTITVIGVTGGTAPYQYSVIQNASAGYPDNLSNYQTSNSVTVTDFGTYQVRVKDACGNFYTSTYQLLPTLPRIQYYWKPNAVCNNATQTLGSNWYSQNPDTNSGSSLDVHPLGIKLEIRDTNATGAVLFSGTIANSSSTFTYTQSPTHVYYVTATNACGLTSSYIHDLKDNQNNPEFRHFDVATGSSGCGVSEQMSININFAQQSFWKYPLTVVVKNAAGTTVSTQTVNSVSSIYHVTGLPIGNYTVTVTDACGQSITKPANNPQSAGTPVMSVAATLNWRCGDLPVVSQPNTLQAEIQVSGYLPDRANAVLTIISGPSNVGVAGTLLENGRWGWGNLLPGTYTVSIVSCDNTLTQNFTIAATNGNLLKQSFTATANSLCGGTGSITSTIVYNGSHNFKVELLNASGTVIQTNSTGNFTNLPAGNYSVRMRVEPWCGAAYHYQVDQTVNLNIAASGSGASMSSSVGVICEDAAGNPLSTGSAYLDISGAGPFTVNYSTSPSGPWTTINNVGNHLVIDDLTANTLYHIQVMDNCGVLKNFTTQIKTMGVLSTTNTVHPCVGAPYALEVPYYSGATYTWTNPQGAVVSNTRTYNIPTYNAGFDGTYVAKITWNNCITRYVQVTVSSNACGQPIAVCYNDAFTGTAGTDSKHGITLLKRAGTDNGNWPMNRKSAHTVLESNTKGFVITRVPTSGLSGITNPVEGMMVYDTTAKCLKLYADGVWSCFKTPACP